MTSTSLSFVTNNVPFFLTIRKNTSASKVVEPQTSTHNILSENIRIVDLKQNFHNCTVITDRICGTISKNEHLSDKSINRIEFVINELVENLYKYSLDGVSNIVTININAVYSNRPKYSTYIITTKNYASTENIRGIVKSFKMIKKEFSEGDSFKYDKSFLGNRGHMGWITITKFNTMTHILASQISKDVYSLETNVLITERAEN